MVSMITSLTQKLTPVREEGGGEHDFHLGEQLLMDAWVEDPTHD